MDCGQWQQTGVWRIRREGLMAVIADVVLARGGDVTGIEAQMFVDKGVAHHNLTIRLSCRILWNDGPV